MIYLLGSLRNSEIPRIARTLREAGHQVYDDWFSPGPDADVHWQMYEKTRGRTFVESMREGWHPKHIFEMDKQHLDAADTVVMIHPCGRSGHLELGYAVGQGKRTYVLFQGEPDRYDIMYKFVTGVFTRMEDLLEVLR